MLGQVGVEADFREEFEPADDFLLPGTEHGRDLTGRLHFQSLMDRVHPGQGFRERFGKGPTPEARAVHLPLQLVELAPEGFSVRIRLWRDGRFAIRELGVGFGGCLRHQVRFAVGFSLDGPQVTLGPVQGVLQRGHAGTERVPFVACGFPFPAVPAQSSLMFLLGLAELSAQFQGALVKSRLEAGHVVQEVGSLPQGALGAGAAHDASVSRGEPSRPMSWCRTAS